MELIIFSILIHGVQGRRTQSEQDHAKPRLLSLQLRDSDLDEVFHMALEEEFLDKLFNDSTEFKNHKLRELVQKSRHELIAKYNSLSQQGKEFVDKKLKMLREIHHITLKGHLLNYEHLIHQENVFLHMLPNEVMKEIEAKMPLIIRLFAAEKLQFILRKISQEKKIDL